MLLFLQYTVYGNDKTTKRESGRKLNSCVYLKHFWNCRTYGDENEIILLLLQRINTQMKWIFYNNINSTFNINKIVPYIILLKSKIAEMTAKIYKRSESVERKGRMKFYFGFKYFVRGFWRFFSFECLFNLWKL